ncbi:MAG: radical SAM family heme chaperone HemW [Dehalococcoidales bacterium]|jgi:oxygen-independent coproporphyrinogen-3 oxidase|nr:radical SAM family heme chaperone HemW [Dehalococcoidales bacterium]
MGCGALSVIINWNMAANISLYIHIPFCIRKCSYCSFVSYSGRQDAMEQYSQALTREIIQRVDNRMLKSVYFGGGTPSLLPADHISRLLECIGTHLPQNREIEISLEANPGTINHKHLYAMLSSGVNRLSIGLQSLDDGELGVLGRLHSSAEGLNAVAYARGVGFKNINLDLIYGIPGQTLPSWQYTLEGVLSLEPEHLSLYGLSLESGTAMMEKIEAGELPTIDPDVSAEQYELAEKILAAKGYRHYEISNWAKPGFECRHNMVYWKNEEYIGVGAGACSHIGGHRFLNTSSLEKYIDAFTGNGAAVESDETISPEMAAAEAAILALRLEEGVEISSYNNDYKTDILSVNSKEIKELESYGLIENNGVNIKLTPRGRLLGNEVFWRFLPASSAQNDTNQVAMERE